MKKIIISLIIGIALAANILPIISYAQTDPANLFPTTFKDGLKTQENVENLPDVGTKFEKLYAGLTKILLGLATVVTVVGFFTAGVMYLSAHGDPEMTKKAKNVILYTIIGIIIIAAAYGITLGITKIKPL